MSKLSFDELMEDGLDEYVLGLLIANNDNEVKKVKYFKSAEKALLIEAFANNELNKYIKEPMVDMFKNLLKNNISVSKVETNNDSAIVTLYGLDSKNESKFNELSEKNPDNYVIKNNIYQLKVDCESNTDKSYGKKLSKLAKEFELQDITGGYMNEEEFLMNVCNCEKVEGLKENADNTNVKITFDENKQEKSFKEYLQQYRYEDLYIPKENRIYSNEYCLEAHQKYLDSIK